MPDGDSQRHQPDQQQRRPFDTSNDTSPQNDNIAASFLFRAFGRALLSLRQICMPTTANIQPSQELSETPSSSNDNLVNADNRSIRSGEDRVTSSVTSTPEINAKKSHSSSASANSSDNIVSPTSANYYTPPSTRRKSESVRPSTVECDTKTKLNFDGEHSESDSITATKRDIQRNKCEELSNNDSKKSGVRDVATQLAELVVAREEIRTELSASVRAHAKACAEAERAARALTIRSLELDNRALELDAREARVSLRERSQTTRASLVDRERRAAACAAELSARRAALNEAAAAQQDELKAERENFWALQRSVSSIVAREIEELQNEQEKFREELRKRHREAHNSIMLMHNAAKKAAAAIVQAGEPVPHELREAAKRVLGIEALSPVTPGSSGSSVGKLDNLNGHLGAGTSEQHAKLNGSSPHLGREDVQLTDEYVQQRGDVRSWTGNTKHKLR